MTHTFNKKGRFIVVEGLEGVGKTTHVNALVALLRSKGLSVVQTREPGGTPVGEQLRQMLLQESMAPMTELLLVLAARIEHCERVIRPRLEAGDWVVSDRFVDSTYAYQGGGRRLPFELIQRIEWDCLGATAPVPDWVVVLDAMPAVSSERVLKRHAASPEQLDRIERESCAFFGRVRAAYLERVAALKERYTLIDATQPLERLIRAWPDLLRQRWPEL